MSLTLRSAVVLATLGLLELSCLTQAQEPAAAAKSAFQPEIVPLPADPDSPDGYDPIERYDAMGIPADNPLTAEKAALGRQLYYDVRLSGDGRLSCYACHVCEKGLTDGLPTAVGAFGKQLPRASPTLWNIGYHSEFYWDGRAKSLEDQALKAWTGANMGASEPEKIVSQLNALEGYAKQFEAVFGGPASTVNVPAALASYMRTIISDDTPWDRVQKGDASGMGPAAQRGSLLFLRLGCTQCHAGVLFTDQQFHNLGVGMDAAEPDLGRFKVTQREQDKGAFKTPTLRDVTRSAPYFHDGSAATLEEAVRFLLAGGRENPWLSDKLKPQQATDEQIADLIEFLKTLEQDCDPTPPRLP